MGKMVVVTALTPEYENEYARLSESLARLCIPHIAYRYPSRGSWEANCAAKAEVVYRTLVTMVGHAVCWIDADGEVKEPLTQLYLYQADGVDVSFRMNLNPDHPWNRAMSGTVWINCTQGGLRFAEEWRNRCAQDPKIWDQVHLADVWDAARAWLAPPRVVSLPPTYCKVFDDKTVPGVPVVVHHQASRRLKDSIR